MAYSFLAYTHSSADLGRAGISTIHLFVVWANYVRVCVFLVLFVRRNSIPVVLWGSFFAGGFEENASLNHTSSHLISDWRLKEQIECGCNHDWFKDFWPKIGNFPTLSFIVPICAHRRLENQIWHGHDLFPCNCAILDDDHVLGPWEIALQSIF